MTPADRLRLALFALDWSQRALAPRIGYNERTVRRWCAGAQEPPEAVLAWLEGLVALLGAHPFHRV